MADHLSCLTGSDSGTCSVDWVLIMYQTPRWAIDQVVDLLSPSSGKDELPTFVEEEAQALRSQQQTRNLSSGLLFPAVCPGAPPKGTTVLLFIRKPMKLLRKVAVGLMIRDGAGFASEALSVLESRVTKEFVKQTRTLLRVKRGQCCYQ